MRVTDGKAIVFHFIKVLGVLKEPGESSVHRSPGKSDN